MFHGAEIFGMRRKTRTMVSYLSLLFVLFLSMKADPKADRDDCFAIES